MKIVHIITGLHTGGAEIILYKLLSCLSQEHFASAAISLSDQGTVGPRLKPLGIPVFEMGMRPGHPSHLSYLVKEYLDPRRLGREGLVDPSVVRSTIEAYLKGQRSEWHRLWSLLVFEIWYEHCG